MGMEPWSHSWVLWPLPRGPGASAVRLPLGQREPRFHWPQVPGILCRGCGGAPVGWAMPLAVWRADRWGHGSREWGWACGLLVRTWGAHTHHLGAGPWAGGFGRPRGNPQKERLGDRGLWGSHHTQGARFHRGELLQLFSQLALARGPGGTHGPGGLRSAGPRPFPGGALGPGEAGADSLQGAGWPYGRLLRVGLTGSP